MRPIERNKISTSCKRFFNIRKIGIKKCQQIGITDIAKLQEEDFWRNAMNQIIVQKIAVFCDDNEVMHKTSKPEYPLFPKKDNRPISPPETYHLPTIQAFESP
jgi:hypothetical protein